ncbi:sensor histidine kinase [Flavivirga spongiicola]|uniref:Histidine kinase n=1 Tax=Flavivirga spongiicola TaxID=421621 RepID=A0ABU7XXT1_9FLAO|nr:histidine kinase [Flavivirga sp. MEBiC05379]MDO5980605.1 histidine kinase [Flavivirga sp. MEBiC05379]
MSHLKTKYHFFNKPFFRHLVFWLGVLLYFIFYISIANYSGYRQLFEFSIAVVSLQIITAYTIIYFLIPHFLNRKKTILFIFWASVLLIVIYALYILFKTSYYDPKYLEYYSPIQKEQASQSHWQRLTDFSAFFSKSIKFLTPAAILLMFRFYKNQQTYLKLNEQKKIAELTALRHQLNPHFLFNTLNNLYALALKKSNQTPEVIEKLSDILDYMLYRCEDTFVPLNKEIELIQNYLSLEKLRYGKRVNITFSEHINKDVKIAPLLLLVFIENAFKHGVIQELKEAFISIKISLNKDDIIFTILNSKPKLQADSNRIKGIGLSNVKKQLELLYGNGYSLYIKDEKETYNVTLKLKIK